MGHIVTVMVNGRKVGECVVEASEPGWDRELVSAMREATKEAAVVVLEREDEDLREGKATEWENLGKVKRQVVTLAGKVEIRRRVYRDGEGQRRKPLDEVMGLGPYSHDTAGVEMMGAYLGSAMSYREAAGLMSWMLGERVTCMRIQRAVWKVGRDLNEAEGEERGAVFGHGRGVEGGKVAAGILYGEVDGVYISLQRERKRRVEVRVGILYTGRKKIGVRRYRLENKVSVTEIVDSSEEWQEKLLLRAYRWYDYRTIKQLVLGGDGGAWIRGSLDRFEIEVIYQLSRFHLLRAARRASPGVVPLVRRSFREGIEAVAEELVEYVMKRTGRSRQKLEEFCRYLVRNVDGLVDYRIRLGLKEEEHPGLGAIEGNVDKLVVQRMKGRGRSWRLAGAKAMLALCRHRTALAKLALHLPPPLALTKSRNNPTSQGRRDDVSWLQASVPALHSSAENRTWARYLRSIANAAPAPFHRQLCSPSTS